MAGAPTTEINSLIFKYPALKKNNYQEEVSIDFILFFYFIPVCGTRSYCIFIADDQNRCGGEGGGLKLIFIINSESYFSAFISKMLYRLPCEIVFASYLVFAE